MNKPGLLLGTIIAISIPIAAAFVLLKGNVSVNSDLIRMKYFTGTEGPEVYWIELNIPNNGESEFIKFMNHEIFETRKGNLTTEQLDFLINLIESKQFYEMSERYGHEDELVCDGDLTIIVVKGKSVFAHCNQGPESFYEIRDALLKTGRDLPNERYGVFIRAEKLDMERIEKVRESFDFISLSGTLNEHPYLKQAVDKPDHFIHIGEWNNTEIQKFVLNEYDYFFIEVDNEYYQVNVYSTED